MDLTGLFVSALLSATLLPGGSEAILLYLYARTDHGFWTLLTVASVGNTIGGMSSYLIGRIFPRYQARRKYTRQAIERITRYGPPALLLSWVPIVGDVLCAAAGWLRINWIVSALYIGVGKSARYAFLLIVL